jgi:Tfp pilus assembly major pilin PilA
MSLDYPEYHPMWMKKHRWSPARWVWLIGALLYYFGLFMAILWPLGTVGAWLQSSYLSSSYAIPIPNLLNAIIVWLVFVALFFAGVGLKSLSYRIYRREEAAGGVEIAAWRIGVPIGFIAIIAILAAITVPMSEVQTVKAKLTNVTNIMSNTASAETAAKSELGGYIDCTDAGEIQSKLGVTVDTKYITDINVIGGIITATIRNTNSVLDGKTLTLTPDATGEKWTWGGTVPKKYEPRN